VSQREQRREPSEAFGFLRQFVRRSDPTESCEMCSTPLGIAHQHLLEPATRKLVCACDACAILFSSQGAKRFKRIPRRVLALDNFHLTDGQWDSLMMPINMAFFFESTPQGRVIALYPSPAGATESLLPLDAWEDIASENAALRGMQSDVEALLVNRLGHARGFSTPEYYIVPIDECFKLVGLIRGHWRGLSGGTEVWQQMAHFFDGLKQKASHA
jgi:hypothetical protein